MPNYISISHNEQHRLVRNVTLVLKEQRKHQHFTEMQLELKLQQDYRDITTNGCNFILS